MNEKILRFVVTSTDPREVFGRFKPGGQTVLNRTTWQGKEPRSCGIRGVKGRPHRANDPSPMVFDVEVSYRPKGCITYTGNTKYDGWTAMMLDRMKDGTLLDGHGQPLKEGQPPVYLPFEAYHDVEFNDIDFGEFVGEFDAPGVAKMSYDEVVEAMKGGMSAGLSSSFVAPHRSRPFTKIILSSQPSGRGRDGFGTQIINLNNSTPQLEQVLLDHLTQLMSDFIEGKVSLNAITTSNFVFVELADSLVDCTPNEFGQDSWFNVLSSYVPLTFLEDLAKRLMAVYAVEASVVDGEHAGLVLKRVESGR